MRIGRLVLGFAGLGVINFAIEAVFDVLVIQERLLYTHCITSN